PAATAPDPRPWPLGDAGPEATLPAGVDGKALAAAVDYAFAERDGMPPARTRAVVVARRGLLLAERYAGGFWGRRPLRGWSAAKTWVGALLGIRVRQGRLDPAAPLPVPEWAGADDPRRALRLDELLRMQSGLQWNEDYESEGSDALLMLF